MTTTLPYNQESLEESIESEENTGKCRICWRTSYLPELLSPCVCNGTQKYTHFECLEHWIQERDSSDKDICDVCHNKYKNIVITQSEKSFTQWLREGEDVVAKVISSMIMISFMVYLINMGCIQFVISLGQINDTIRYIQLILIIFFSFIFTLFFVIALFVFRSDFKEWQTSHMNIEVQRLDVNDNLSTTESSVSDLDEASTSQTLQSELKHQNYGSIC